MEAGYATSLVKEYSRKRNRCRGLRIKEWDYYYIGNQHQGIAFTVADNDYLWLASVTLFDFDQKKEITKTKMGFFSRGKLKMPNSSEKGNVIFKIKGMNISYLHENGKRHIIANVKNLEKNSDLKADIYLEQTIKDSMVIVTPFKKRKHYYYNQKINLLKANGSISYQNRTISLNESYGVLDWGRGVWTYQNTWYWASLSGVYQGKKIGFNLGYGFGDTKKATENMLFVDDQTYKLEDVTFNIPKIDSKDDFMSSWTLTSKDLAINLKFEPVLDRYSHTNILIISSNQHQVFGKFSGTFKISESKTIEIHDMMGFAEKVKNRW
jgi:hypothetical protein